MVLLMDNVWNNFEIHPSIQPMRNFNNVWEPKTTTFVGSEKYDGGLNYNTMLKL